jgi:hypothetical protein
MPEPRFTPIKNDASVSPCFYWAWCGRRSALEKAGRTVCRRCAANLYGAEYPLRDPAAEPPYLTSRLAAEALDMHEDPAPVLSLELDGLRIRTSAGGRIATTPAR